MGSRRAMLMTAQEKIACGMTAENVKVCFNSSRPMANVEARTIHLPPMPEIIDDATEINTRSWMDHEIAHLRFKSTQWPPRLFKDPVLKELSFNLEDCRVDRENGEKYPGTRDNRRKGFDLVRPELKAANLLQAAFYVLYETVHGYFQTADSISYWAARLQAPEAATALATMMAAIPKQIAEAKAARSADGVIRVATDIKRIWKRFFRQPPADQNSSGNESTQSSQAMGDGGKFGQNKKQSKPQKSDSADSSESSDSPPGEGGSGAGDESDKTEDTTSGSSSGTSSGSGDDSEDTREDAPGEEDESDGGSGDKSDVDSSDDSDGDSDNDSDDKSGGDSDGDSDGKSAGDPDSNAGQDAPSDTGDSGVNAGETPSDSASEPAPANPMMSAAAAERAMQKMARKAQSVSAGEQAELEKRLCTPPAECEQDPEGYRPFTGQDRETVLQSASAGLYRLSTGGPLSPAEFRSEVRAKLGTLQRRLLMDLMSRRRLWVKDRDHGVVDDTRLSRVPTGDKRVYKRRLRRPALNVAISVVLDMSGSMMGTRMYLCGQLGYVLGETLSLVRVPYEVVGFTTGNGNGSSNRPVSGVYYHRDNALELIEIKPFSMTHRSDMLGRFYAAAMYQGGGTVEGEGVWWAAKRLAVRNEERKILVVICDGGPCGSPAGHPKFEEHAGDVIRRIRQYGIETIHVGICTDDPLKYAPSDTFVRYDGLDDLLTGFYSQLGAILRGERRRNEEPVPTT